MGLFINVNQNSIVNINSPYDEDTSEFGIEVDTGVFEDDNISPKCLNDYSWADIDEICQYGLARKAFGLGAYKNLVLKNGDKLIVQINGFDHDMDADGNTIATTWDFKIVPREEHSMNNDWMNKGGWRDCVMRKWLNEDFIKFLPDDLHKVIKTAAKYNRISNFNGNIVTLDKLWLKSEQEKYGRKIYSYGGEGRQYELEARENNPWYREDADGGVSSAWLRSPYICSTNTFCFVNGSGIISNDYASNDRGFAPCLCI